MARAINVALRLWLSTFSVIFIATDARQIIVPQGMPDIGFPTNQLNTDFGIFLLRPSDVYKGEQRIFLVVEPGSGDIIEFDHVDVRAFLYKEGTWVEIKSISLRRSFHSIDIMHAGFPWLAINPSEIHKPAMLRIFFITTITEIFTSKDDVKMNKKSVSYTDVYLQP